MNLEGKSLCDWYTGIIGEKGALPKGMSVAHAAFSVAAYIGGGPIIFVGQDHEKLIFSDSDLDSDDKLHMEESEEDY